MKYNAPYVRAKGKIVFDRRIHVQHCVQYSDIDQKCYIKSSQSAKEKVGYSLHG